jgi:superfamily II DNA or RNA helicase
MGRRESWGEKLVVAGVQSLGGANSTRLNRLRPDDFDVIVCDEAHHSAADTYLRVFEHFGLRDPGNKKLLLGVTATPFRADNKKLVPGVYQEIVSMMTMLQAIEEGWICDLRSYRIEKTETDLDHVQVRTGDFAENELEKAVNNKIRNALIAKEGKRLAGSRRTLVFAVTIPHAQDLAAAFRDYGVAAQAVWGEDREREKKLSDHKRGVIQVLCNCALLTEGYDDRGIECIVMARPTLSRVLFVQMIGRGTRVEEGLTNLVEARRNNTRIAKPECLIIDVVDNTKEHDLITLPRLFNSSMDFRGKSLTEIRRQAKPGEISNPYLNSAELLLVERLKVDLTEVDLFRGARREVQPVEKPKTYCPYCHDVIAEGTLREHLKDCPKRAIPCQKCDFLLRTQQWKKFKQHGREHGLVPPERRRHGLGRHPPPSTHCPYCGVAVHRNGLQGHMKKRCPKRPNASTLHPAADRQE